MSKLIISLLGTCLLIGTSHAADFKVLVVMSYEEDNPWVKEIREGIDGVLANTSEIVYFYMNTKKDRAGGAKKAEEAMALYKSLQPNGVITADDDAQAMFVVPYLKDRVTTPVIFNGVNAEASAYGYPNAHISGVLERAHVRESLAFAKQLLPNIGNACILTNQVPAGQALRDQVEMEKTSYPAHFQSFFMVKTVDELQALGKTLNNKCDSLLVDSLEGIADQAGNSLNNLEVLRLLKRIYDRPILAGNRYQVEQGAWAAVVKTGQEQGELSAEMLLAAMRGKPVSEIPITKNIRGQRVINVTALEAHQLTLKPMVLRGATLVREQP